MNRLSMWLAISVVLTSIRPCSFATNAPTTRLESATYGFMRHFDAAASSAAWRSATSLAARAWTVREEAIQCDVMSEPVSDRYMITCYGGPVDLVHFLGLACVVCSGKREMEEALFLEWEHEGGWENLRRFNYTTPPEATPDDLPSNALGALFGRELQRENGHPDFDLRQAFEQFVAPLIPVPDALAKQYSHATIVLGLSVNPTRAEDERAHAWFTAVPLNLSAVLNAAAERRNGIPICRPARDGADALAMAGFEVIAYKDRPVVTVRKPRAGPRPSAR